MPINGILCVLRLDGQADSYKKLKKMVQMVAQLTIPDAFQHIRSREHKAPLFELPFSKLLPQTAIVHKL